jgi:hypothetical protein
MSEHGGTSLSQITIDAKVIALYSTLSQLLLDKYEQLALTDKSRTPAESAACIEATVQAVKAARAREREKYMRDEQIRKQVRTNISTYVYSVTVLGLVVANYSNTMLGCMLNLCTLCYMERMTDSLYA